MKSMQKIMAKNSLIVTDNTETLMEYIDNSKTLFDETKAEAHVQFYDNAVTQMDTYDLFR